MFQDHWFTYFCKCYSMHFPINVTVSWYPILIDVLTLKKRAIRWRTLYNGLHVNFPVFLLDLHQNFISRQIFEEYFNVKFDENLSSRSWRVSYGGTDRQTWHDWHEGDYSYFFPFLRQRPIKTIHFRHHSILQSTDDTKVVLYITTVTRLTHRRLWHISETKFMVFTGITKIDYRQLAAELTHSDVRGKTCNKQRKAYFLYHVQLF